MDNSRLGPYDDSTFSQALEERARGLIAQGINPYDQSEAMAHGVEWIPESVEQGRDSVSEREASAIRTIAKKIVPDKYSGFYEVAKTLASLPLDAATGTKRRLLMTSFKRFDKGEIQDLTVGNYTPVQIGALFNSMYEYSRLQVERK